VSLSLSQRAYEVIKADVIACRLEPGQQIAQPQLAEKYQLGMTPIREALRRLTQEGYVQPIPRFGYRVSPITFSDVHEIYELRSVVESVATRLAAVRGSSQSLEQIAREANFVYVYQNHSSYSEFLVLNTAFHRSIALAAGNSRLVDLIAKLLEEMTRVFHLGLDLRDSAEEMRDEHVALAEALYARDPDQAEKIVQSQIARSQQRVLEALTYHLCEDSAGALRRAVQVKPLPSP
jgi:DNA-binding GntR family transcriptional regulator